MRFIDYDGSGNLNPQDITTSIAVDEAMREDETSGGSSVNNLGNNPGCVIMAALIALPLLIITTAF